MSSSVEKEIAESFAKAYGRGLREVGLRFDRVVLRLQGEMRDFGATVVPAGTMLLITMPAPIKLPAKTLDILKERLPEFLESKAGSTAITVHGNKIRISKIKASSPPKKRVSLLVHNRDAEMKQLIAFAETWFQRR